VLVVVCCCVCGGLVVHRNKPRLIYRKQLVGLLDLAGGGWDTHHSPGPCVVFAGSGCLMPRPGLFGSWCIPLLSI